MKGTNPYMFQHRSAIFWESSNTKDHKSNSLLPEAEFWTCHPSCSKTPWWWHFGTTICRGWYLSWTVFYDVFIVFY